MNAMTNETPVRLTQAERNTLKMPDKMQGENISIMHVMIGTRATNLRAVKHDVHVLYKQLWRFKRMRR